MQWDINLLFSNVALSSYHAEVLVDDTSNTFCYNININTDSSSIQRFGRVNRKRSKDTIGKYKPVHVVKLEGSVLPYKAAIVKASFDQFLQDDSNVCKNLDLDGLD